MTNLCGKGSLKYRRPLADVLKPRSMAGLFPCLFGFAQGVLVGIVGNRLTFPARSVSGYLTLDRSGVLRQKECVLSRRQIIWAAPRYTLYSLIQAQRLAEGPPCSAICACHPANCLGAGAYSIFRFSKVAYSVTPSPYRKTGQQLKSVARFLFML